MEGRQKDLLMDNIRIIYRILSVLEASMDIEAFDERSI